MAKVLPISEASAMVSEVSLLTATMDSLSGEIDKLEAQIEGNRREIQRVKNLETQNIGLEAKIKGLRENWHSKKDERDSRVKILSEAGWTIPVPKQENVKGRISL